MITVLINLCSSGSQYSKSPERDCQGQLGLSSSNPRTYISHVVEPATITTAKFHITAYCEGIPIVYETTDLEIIALIGTAFISLTFFGKYASTHMKDFYGN